MKNKLLTATLIILSTILVLPIGVAAAGETQTYPPYISAVELVAISRDESAMRNMAIEAINAKGCECYLEYDFNKFSKGDYVMLGYSRTDDESKAIRSLGTMFVNRGETAPATFNDYGIEYRLASNTEFNSGTEYVQVYLYYSTDVNAGSPLKELYVEDHYIEPDIDNYPRILVNSSDGERSELDYSESSGCDSKIENHCYLYRNYDKEYYDSRNEDALQGTRVDEISYIASLFNEKPAAVIAISIGLVILIGGAVVLIIVKQRRKTHGTKE